MPEAESRFPWFRAIAVLLICSLFIADFAFDIMAKPVPDWAYFVLGLLAVGIEGNAVGRLIMQIARAVARVPQEENDQ